MAKHFSLILIVFSLLFLSSCSKDSSTGPVDKPADPALGKVSLRLDKTNAPSNVARVTATLSRAGCDTLTKNLSIFDSSDAEVSFEMIKTGTWHLKIEAKSSTNLLLYTGETDLVVEDSKTTDVYMTLTPVPTGVGSVYISIKWGTTGWTDYYNNPIFTYISSPTNPLYITQEKVLYEEGKYKMWYMNTYYSAKADFNYAESVDGIHWHSASDQPVLSPGTSGAWDDYSIGMGAVIKDDGLYKMYYCGYRDQYGKWSVGLAVSQDGIHWEKNPSPVLTPSDYEEKVGAGSVFKKDGVYYMIYNYAKDNGERGICLATSPEGVQWTKYSGNPVLKADQTWEGTGIYAPSVVYDNGQYKMVYMNMNADAFGSAISADGIHWIKKSSEPFFKLSQLKWCSRIAYPFIGKFNGEYRLYYSGGSTSGFNMALATSTVF
jgi:predicted GH43/DUF377 family glycosyl hydrolase